MYIPLGLWTSPTSKIQRILVTNLGDFLTSFKQIRKTFAIFVAILLKLTRPIFVCEVESFVRISQMFFSGACV